MQSTGNREFDREVAILMMLSSISTQTHKIVCFACARQFDTMETLEAHYKVDPEGPNGVSCFQASWDVV